MQSSTLTMHLPARSSQVFRRPSSAKFDYPWGPSEMFDPEDFAKLAMRLVQNPCGPADSRTAISRAYYAAFLYAKKPQCANSRCRFDETDREAQASVFDSMVISRERDARIRPSIASGTLQVISRGGNHDALV